jgi:hypothetical protein
MYWFIYKYIYVIFIVCSILGQYCSLLMLVYGSLI